MLFQKTFFTFLGIGSMQGGQKSRASQCSLLQEQGITGTSCILTTQ